MRTSHKLIQALLSMCALAVMTAAALGADPGSIFPPHAEISDQKAGSVLYYPYYTSSATATASHDTRLNITNTSTTSGAFVHLFWVDGANCTPANEYITLTQNQTATFLASDRDPGKTGFLVAVAVDGLTGCPVNFNFLIGDEYVKRQEGFQANLGAEAISALYLDGNDIPVLPGCTASSVTATLNFDGIQYNRVPRTLAIASVPSRLDGNRTLLAVTRTGGSLVTGVSSIGDVFGLAFDDAENGKSWGIFMGCQFVRELSDDFPRTTPRFNLLIPAGHTGWMKFWAVSENRGMVGAVLNFNPNAATNKDAFTGGHNLHKLTLTNEQLVMPIFPPS